MGFKLMANYDFLKHTFQHQVDLLKLDHGVPDDHLLREPRKTQVLFLNKAIALLDVSSHKDDARARILNGLLLNMLHQVELEGSYSSFFEGSLRFLLGLNSDNKHDADMIELDAETAEQLHRGALSFFKAMTIDEEGNPIKNSPFEHIERFSSKNFINSAYALIERDGDVVYAEEQKKLAAAYAEKQKELAAAYAEKMATMAAEKLADLAVKKNSEYSSKSWLPLSGFFSSSSSSASPSITITSDAFHTNYLSAAHAASKPL